MKNILIFSFLSLSIVVHSQADERLSKEYCKKYSYTDYMNYFNALKGTNIGPTIMSGRVVDIEVDPNDVNHFYVAFATGGLWETTNNGVTFSPIFNERNVFGIGDFSVDWVNHKIYVGTGECNSSRSSYAGLGIFCSDNNGKTWKHLGLEKTQHISRVLINPNNTNEIFVAAIGHLFTYNDERGVFKSTDGGLTWEKTLFIDDKTGVIDLIFDPQNPNVLYASAWQRERTAWNFEEAGKNSGIYKSTDNGKTWKNISGHGSGFPHGEGVGRIGLAVSYYDSNVLYAFLDNQDHREKQQTSSTGLTKESFKKMTKEEFLKLDRQLLNDYLRNNDFPEKYSANSVCEMVKNDKILPIALAEYLEDANALLFDTPVKGAELYRSNDGGLSWFKTHQGYLDNMVFTYGYYFGQVRVNPKNHDNVYLAAFFVANSNDAGKTFKNINGENVHVDHHALYINPKNPKHLINGNDGGVNISYDDGNTWVKCIHPEVGQFYTVAVDNAEVYNVYGGLQDNGVWYGANTYTNNSSWLMEGKNPYQPLLGGDGMQIQVDLRDNNTVYTGWQFGAYFRINKQTGESKYISPKHDLGEKPLRFNWQTPIHLSTHQYDVLYLGANKLYRSLNKGDDFKCISPDLTNGGKKGDVAYGTITAIHESPLKFGLIYTGSDDGLVYVSKDGGNDWENITSNLPKGYWVRRVIASAHNESRVYICLNGHTFDDFKPLLFVSDDYGKNWRQLGSNLPYFPVNVIREDVSNAKVLYLGTENGIYVSIDGGEEFFPLTNNFPVVPVHDIAIQEKNADLIAATHGRSLYKFELEDLQKLNDSILQYDFSFFKPMDMKKSNYWGKISKWYENESTEPVLEFTCFSKKVLTEINYEIYNEYNELLNNGKANIALGLQKFKYNLTIKKEIAEKWNTKNSKDKNKEKFIQSGNGNYYLNKGKYKCIIVANGKRFSQEFNINEN